MFTGLIGELGSITAIEKSESSAVFTISAPKLISQISVGDSVAVNGVCLTATAISGNVFSADVMVQTLSLTSLSQLNVASPVNLELAAQLNSRLGGHMVQGHVDGVAKVVGLTPGDKWAQLDIAVPSHLAKYIVNQGSICLDGVSLT
ncbi:MAG: riboflavin synthase, partial [Actinobacteria bacterium]|nr:riboflavin synthase [Actinomycetota bacterium]